MWRFYMKYVLFLLGAFLLVWKPIMECCFLLRRVSFVTIHTEVVLTVVAQFTMKYNYNPHINGVPFGLTPPM